MTQEGKTDPFVHEKEIAAIAASIAAVWTASAVSATVIVPPNDEIALDDSEKHRGPEALKRHARRRVKGRVRSPNWQVASGQSGFWETSTSLRKLAGGTPPCSSSPRKRGPRGK